MRGPNYFHLGNSANTDSIHQAKGEPGQAPVPTPTLETNKHYLHLDVMLLFCQRTVILYQIFENVDLTHKSNDSDKNRYVRKNNSDPNSQFLTHGPPFGVLNFKNDCNKNFFHFQFGRKIGLKPVTSAGMTFFWLIFVVIGGKVEIFCLIWGIYAIFAKKKQKLTLHNSLFH